MRRLLWGVAATLCVLAVFAWIGRAQWRRVEAQRQYLEIEVLSASDAVEAMASAEGPTVLIYHTHTWEAYEMTEDTTYTPTETWRTKDERYNMIRVGNELAEALTALGFCVTHDTTAFEPPNLSTAYTRSLEMIEERLARGETYDYILDIHRDAYSGLWNGANGVQNEEDSYAYVMMLVGKGTGETGAGFDERPDWPENLELAQAITDAMNADVPGIARDVKIKTGRFNQHVSTGALLIEVGNNANTLDEALAACPVIARGIAEAHAARTAQQSP